ncbi:MAG: UvrD-helicase domain-containing protein [Bacilli bacterium]
MKFTYEQELALKNYKENVILSAGAGSGKTAVLTEKVYRLIKSGVHPSRLLVLTFTEAAAFEMKQRILGKISKDLELFHLVPALNSSHIETFDSYYLFLAKKYSKLSMHTQNLTILEPKIEEQFINDIINEEFLNNSAIYSQSELIYNYAFRDERNIKEMVLVLFKFLQDIENWNDFYNEKVDKFLTFENLSKLYNEFISNNKAKLLKLEISLLNKITNVDYANAESENLDSLLSEKSNDMFIEKLENYKFTSSRMAKFKIDDESKTIVATYKKQFETIGKSITKNIFTRDQFDLMIKNKHLINELFNICKKIKEKLDFKKETMNSFTFKDVASFALNIVRNKEVNSYLKETIDFILVDEYQDTSDSQEEFLNEIGNNNIFMVGDIKQSIYRFRSANCKLFSDKFEKYSNKIGGSALCLNTNFRSRVEVISTINELFSNVMSIECGGADYKVSHKILSGNDELNSNKNSKCKYGIILKNYSNMDNYVCKYSKSERTKEIEFIARDILTRINSKEQVYDSKIEGENKFRDIKFSDFAILSRSKLHFDSFRRIFLYFHIPLSVLDGVSPKQVPSFVLIISLLHLYYSTEISSEYNPKLIRKFFTSVARSYAVQYSDQKIYDILTSSNENDFKKDLIFTKLKQIKKDNFNDDISFLLSRLISDFNLIEMIYSIDNVQANLDQLENIYNIIVDYANKGNSLSDIISFLDNLTSSDSKIEYDFKEDIKDTVKLMSIHKSKGLEFKKVYLPFVKNTFRNKTPSEKIVCSKEFGIQIPLLNSEVSSQPFSFLKAFMLMKEKEANVQEELRLFYVTLTRAIDEVVVTSKCESLVFDKLCSTCYGNFLSEDYCGSYIIDNVCGSSEKILDDELTVEMFNEDLNDTKVNNFDYEFPINKISKKASKDVINDEEIASVLELGTEIHNLLEITDFKTKNTAFIKDLTKRKIVDNVLKNPLFDNLNDAKIFKEYEFNDNEIHGFIDLIIEYQNHIDIIDYKLKDISDKAYEKQLHIYKDYVFKFFKKDCRTYLISAIDGIAKEVI